jgi:hypothetical protein
MKLNLLELTQAILNDMDGDEVDTILETIESAQVADIIKITYLEMMANRNWPHMRATFNLIDSATSTTAPLLYLPSNVKELEWIKYNKRTSTDTRDKYEDLVYKQPKDFVDELYSRESSATNVSIVLVDGLKLFIRNDKHPQYWTSFDDNMIIVDSFDSAVEVYVEGGRTSCYGVLNPDWSHTDTYTPSLPAEAFPALLEEAKSTAFYALRQVANEKAEQKATRQNRWLSRKAWRTKGGVRYPNYGRKKAFSGYEKNPLLDKG